MSSRNYQGIPYWGQEPDDQTKQQMQRCEATSDRCAFMADHHLGYAVPIGGVVAYRGNREAVPIPRRQGTRDGKQGNNHGSRMSLLAPSD